MALVIHKKQVRLYKWPPTLAHMLFVTIHRSRIIDTCPYIDVCVLSVGLTERPQLAGMKGESNSPLSPPQSEVSSPDHTPPHTSPSSDSSLPSSPETARIREEVRGVKEFVTLVMANRHQTVACL